MTETKKRCADLRQIHDAIAKDKRNLLSALISDANGAAEKRLLGSDLSGLDRRQRRQAQYLASAVVIRQLKDLCESLAQEQVNEARANGASWSEIASGTGYFDAGAARLHYAPGIQRKPREASSRPKGVWKAINDEIEEQMDILCEMTAGLLDTAKRVDDSADVISSSAESINRSAKYIEVVRD